MGAPLRAEIQMAKGWEILAQAIPYGGAEDVAEGMGVSVDTVHRWMKRTNSNEDPNATGRRNPIDYALRLIKEVDDVNPDNGADLILDAFLGAVAQLKQRRSRAARVPIRKIEATLRARAREFEQLADSLAGMGGEK